VLGVEDEQWGQTPKAFVVTGADLDAEDVTEFCRESDLADYKRPRRVAFVDEIPRNPGGGSVLTDELRAMG
jgi:acyl-CoA synthetase (AMP-forming)/AMP-acid ligase II